MRHTALFTILTTCLAAAAVAAPGPARIRLDLGRDLGPVNRLVLGTNMLGYQAAEGETSPARLQYSDRGAGVWDPEKRASVPEMVALAREAGVSVARWPGGCGSHNFVWKRTVGPLEKRPNQRFGLPEFLRNTADMGAVPIITVAEYAGTAQDAADLVEYCNAPNDGKHQWAALRAADGHPEPWNVTWFEYGNESDHGNHGGEKMSPAAYADSFRLYREAMCRVDPRVKLGAVLFNTADTNFPEWTRTVLERAGKEMDFAIHHCYLPRYNGNDGQPDARALFSIALAGDRQLDEHYQALNALMKETTGRDDIPLAITEFNGHFVQEKPAPYRLCLGNALVNAEIVRVLMRPEHRVAVANFWQFSNEYWGAVKGYEPPHVRRPNHLLFQLYASHFGDVLVPAAVECAGFDSPGGFGVEPAAGRPQPEKLGTQNLLPPQDWTIAEVAGVVAREYHGALLIDFRTDADFNYYHAGKRMAAQPNTWYRLTAVLRAEGLNSVNGGCVQIGDGRGFSVTKSVAITPTVRGDSDWIEVTADYRTLPETRDLTIQARRMENGGAGEGLFIVGPVKVQALVPGNRGATPVLGVNASRAKDGKRAFLMITNKNLTAPEEVLIEGARATAARAWTLTGPAVDATNEEQPDRVAIRDLAATVENGAVRLTLPACSVTAVEIEIEGK